MQVLRRTILTFVGIAVSFAGGIFPALAQNNVTPAVQPTPPGNFIIVNNGPLASDDPHVSGDLVCYSNLNASNGSVTVHSFNLATQMDSAIPQQQTQDLLCDVRGSTITFTRVFPDGTQAIMQFDASTGGQLVEVAPLPKPFRQASNIGDQTIAWQDLDFGPLVSDAKIVAYNRADGSTQVLTPGTVPQMQEWASAVSPDGSVVVYLRCPTLSQFNQCSTWGARLANGSWTAQQLVSEVQGSQSHPDTDGTIIAYGANYLTNGIAGDHLVWQSVTGGTEQVLNLQGSLVNPSVSSGFIAFSLKGPTDPSYQIAIYNTADNVLYNVQADLIAAGVFPQIPGDSLLSDISVTPDGKVRLVWRTFDTNTNQPNVYAYTFSLGAADLSIESFGFPNRVRVGQEIAYGMVVHNAGPDTASSVVVTDPLPPNTEFVGAIASQGRCTGPGLGNTGTVSCELGNLANGSYAVVGIAVKVIGGAGSTITNTAMVGASSLDPNQSNNSASVSTAVQSPNDD